MKHLYGEVFAVAALLLLALFLSTYHDFVAEGNAISRSFSLPAWSGSPYSLFDSYDIAEGEMLLEPSPDYSLHGSTVAIKAKGDYIYKDGWIWSGGQWNKIEFSADSEMGGGSDYIDRGWVSKAAVASFAADSPGTYWFIAYTCQYVNGAWKCGCRTQSDCGKWQMQSFTVIDSASCYDFRTELECSSNRNLRRNVECEWTTLPSTAICAAYSGSCKELAKADCDRSVIQGLRCEWQENKCVDATFKQQEKIISISGMAVGDSAATQDPNALYCPGFQKTFESIIDAQANCPAGCKIHGGISSATFCISPGGRSYTVGEVQLAQSNIDDSFYNPCSALSYCECVPGGTNPATCGTSTRTAGGDTRDTGDDAYLNTLGQIYGCSWQANDASNPRAGYCISQAQAATRLGRQKAAREGSSCGLVGTLQQQGNDCFLCDGSKWNKIETKQSPVEFTTCETIQSGRLSSDIAQAFLDKRDLEMNLQSQYEAGVGRERERIQQAEQERQQEEQQQSTPRVLAVSASCDFNLGSVFSQATDYTVLGADLVIPEIKGNQLSFYTLDDGTFNDHITVRACSSSGCGSVDLNVVDRSTYSATGGLITGNQVADRCRISTKDDYKRFSLKYVAKVARHKTKMLDIETGSAFMRLNGISVVQAGEFFATTKHHGNILKRTVKEDGVELYYYHVVSRQNYFVRTPSGEIVEFKEGSTYLVPVTFSDADRAAVDQIIRNADDTRKLVERQNREAGTRRSGQNSVTVLTLDQTRDIKLDPNKGVVVKSEDTGLSYYITYVTEFARSAENRAEDTMHGWVAVPVNGRPPVAPKLSREFSVNNQKLRAFRDGLGKDYIARSFNEILDWLD